MKVEGTSPNKPGAVRRRSGVASADGTSFADALESESAASATATPGASAPPAPASINALFALQGTEAEEGDAAAARAKHRAEDLLRKLDLLRLDILTGGIPRAHLIGLAQSIKTMRDQVFDPRLAEVLDEIDLRAQVELAKYDPYR